MSPGIVVCRYPRSVRIVMGSLVALALLGITTVTVVVNAKNGFEPVLCAASAVGLALLAVCLWQSIRVGLGLDEAMVMHDQITVRRGPRRATIAMRDIEHVEFSTQPRRPPAFSSWVLYLTDVSGRRVTVPLGLSDVATGSNIADVLLNVIPRKHAGEVRRAAETLRLARQ